MSGKYSGRQNCCLNTCCRNNRKCYGQRAFSDARYILNNLYAFHYANTSFSKFIYIRKPVESFIKSIVSLSKVQTDQVVNVFTEEA